VIEHYRFGSLTLDGDVHTSDVIIHGGSVQSWWRKTGHSVTRADLEELVARSPATLVIGTGAYGMMRVPADTRRFIEEQGIVLQVEKTGVAVETFNRLLDEGADVAIAMHLTC